MSETAFWHQAILAWYEENKRDLPWRNISDPYRIWVSEILLQQTRVTQCRAYYKRFLEAFPQVENLAEASEDDVLRIWQGLGYYSRARNMHAAAREIVKAGGFPRTFAKVRKLKGVGDYTAAAICSFAFGLPYAVVDGNVYRVLSRFFGIATPIDTTCGKREFAKLAQSLLPNAQIADYNQALMDFGASQCVPFRPDCRSCILVACCAAWAENRVGQLPVKAHRRKVSERFFVYVLVETPQGLWLHRREEGDIWQGLYEVPLIEFDHAPNASEVLAHPFVERFSHKMKVRGLIHGLKHELTHRRIWADGFALTLCEPTPTPNGFLLVDINDLENYAVPRLVEILLQRWQAYKTNL